MYPRKPAYDRTLLLVVSGSRAFGTNRPDSDTDYKGVFAALQREVDGVYPLTDRDQTFAATGVRDWTDRDGSSADWQLHEVAKFCRLAASCNPTALETLWSVDEHIVIVTRFGEELLDMRRDFLSAPSVRGAYLEYASSQLRRMTQSHTDPNDPRRAKHAKHLKRLLAAGYQLWSTGEMELRVEDPEEYHRFGDECQSDERNEIVAATVQQYRELFDSTATVLPDKPDLSRAHSLVARVRNEYRDTSQIDYRRNLKDPPTSRVKTTR